MAEAFARAIVAARVFVVAAWIAVAVFTAVSLPTLSEAQSGALKQLVPADSRALEAEQLSADLFAFPLASRTVVVERHPDGLSSGRLAATARMLRDVNRNLVPEIHAEGVYGITNAIGGLPFAREYNTATLAYLLFVPEFSQNLRLYGASSYVSALDVPPGGFVGITGAIPGRAAQAELIEERLPLIELVTVVIITATAALYLRSLLAPFIILLTVGLAYVVSVRFVAVVGKHVGVSVPPEVEPIMVALLFGVITDYGLFYMSRFRRRLLAGEAPRPAASATAQELTPLILACGVAVAVGSAALAVADLGFLRAFGPGMALAVLVGLIVTITFMPAAMACAGRALLWPAPARSPGRHAVRTNWLDRMIATAVRAPFRTTIASLLLLAAMASGLAWLQIGNPLIRGLPSDSEPRRAYEQLSTAFAPGASSPMTLVVSAPGIATRRRQLASLQQVLENQPGIAGVIGPATSPTQQGFGIVVSPGGDAVRYVIVDGNDPLSATAVRLFRSLDARTADLLEAVGLPRARALYAGDTAITSELIETAEEDLLRVGPLVLIAVALILAIFLRALVAPVYLVLLAALAPLAALGLAVAFFQGLLGQPEITYFVPLASGVLLVALGSDYNIFLVGRIWDEAERRPLTEAIVAAGSGASHAISAAGLVLSASFAALALVPVDAFEQLGFVLAVGLLLDAFLVRTVLTPAIISLVGERSSWPSRRLAAPRRTRLPAPAAPAPPGAPVAAHPGGARPPQPARAVTPGSIPRAAATPAAGRTAAPGRRAVAGLMLVGLLVVMAWRRLGPR